MLRLHLRMYKTTVKTLITNKVVESILLHKIMHLRRKRILSIRRHLYNKTNL